MIFQRPITVESRIDTDGNRRWLVVTWKHGPKGDVEIRERWPLHMDKLPEEKRKFFMEQAAKRLHARIVKKAGMQSL